MNTQPSAIVVDRKLYIGSSDAQDIMSGKYDRLYKLKKGLIEEDDLSDTFPVQLGKHVEDFHLDWTTRKLNEQKGGSYKFSKEAKPGEQHWAVFTPDDSFNYPILGSHPDALLRDVTGVVYPIEVKITGRFRDASEAADFYMPQLQHHMLCWNTDLILFSVIVGTSEPERIWVGASEEWQKYYLDKCDTFWGYLKADMAPPPQMYDDPKQAKVPNSVKATVPLNGFKKRSLDGDNSAPTLIRDFILTKREVDRHGKIKEDLKGLMRDDENELYTDGFVMKRDARGAIRITVKDETKFVGDSDE